MMSYKGYQAVLKYDDEAEVFHGEVVGTRDVVFFEGASVEELNREFQFSINDYLDFCAERGHEPDKRFSGQISLTAFFSQRVIILRVSPDVHRAANAIAKSEGKSLNAWIAETVERAV